MLGWLPRTLETIASDPGRAAAGCTAGLAALFSPIGGLVLCAVLFVAADFVTGVAASRACARREGRPWAFESRRARDTVYKLLLLVTGIVMASLLDSLAAPFTQLRMANIFTGFACGVEFWSFLENASDISSSPMFRRFKKYFRKRMH